RESIDPLGRRTRFEYDALGQVTSRVANYIDGDYLTGDSDEDATQQTLYAVVGGALTVEVVDFIHAANIETRRTFIKYDALGRQTEIVHNYNGTGSSADANIITRYA